MANRELLLMILVTVIVAISIGVAFQTINSGELSPNRAAIVQGLNDVIGRSRAYYEREKMYGGGSHSFEGITFDDLLMDSVSTQGSYSIIERKPTYFKITGNPANLDEVITVTIYRDSVIWE